MLIDIRVTTQYRENYGTESQPYWKMKGSMEFIIPNVDDEILYNRRDIIDRAISTLLIERSNSMASFELLDWEPIFTQPFVLSTERFMEVIPAS